MSEATRTIARDIGRVLQALAGLVFVSLLVAVAWGEYYVIPAMLVSGAIPLLIGRALAVTCADADAPGTLHGMVIAALSWAAVAVFGSLPFLLIAWTVSVGPPILDPPSMTPTLAAFTDPLNALFESTSGFTGTGLTMTDDESVLPRTLQWWRTFTEWIGGVGVIVLTTAILARPGSGSLTLYESEARSKKIHPSIVSTVRTIWWIFLLFTFVSIVLLWLAGMPLWGAINHGMTGLSTGGFSITDNSIATYDSALIDAALLPIMTLGSIAFPVHYLVLRGDLRRLYTDLQARWLFGLFAAGTTALAAFLLGSPYGPRDAVRYGTFQLVSALTCTGFQTAVDATNVALGRWPAAAQLTVAGAMVIGGAAGSTVGGIKIVRLVTLIKGTRHRIAGVFVPETTVRRLRIDGRRLDPIAANREFQEAAIIAFLWTVFLVAGAFVLLVTLPADAFTLENVLFEVASAQGNVGLSAGITGPSMPALAKTAFLFNMWIGRLEIVPVLVTLRVLFDLGGVYR